MASGFTHEEEKVFQKFVARLRLARVRVPDQVAVGLIGLPGTLRGKVAERLVRALDGALMVSADALRIELRGAGLGYGRVREAVDRIAALALAMGHSVVIDSDHIEAAKRATLRKIAREAGAFPAFVRVLCEPDAMFGRIITEKPLSPRDDLFEGAGSAWAGREKWRAVKAREAWRRTPLHFRWEEGGGGRWAPRGVRGAFEIETTDPETIPAKVKAAAEEIRLSARREKRAARLKAEEGKRRGGKNG